MVASVSVSFRTSFVLLTCKCRCWNGKRPSVCVCVCVYKVSPQEENVALFSQLHPFQSDAQRFIYERRGIEHAIP